MGAGWYQSGVELTLLGGAQQVPGNGFPDGGIVALCAAAVAFFVALHTVFARRGGGRLAAGRKQYYAKRERKREDNQPDKGF